jgi:hypothetical protein
MRAVPGQPGEIVNSQDGSTSDCGHRRPVQHAILSENQASPPACRLLLWQPEELLQVREIVVRVESRCGAVTVGQTYPFPPASTISGCHRNISSSTSVTACWALRPGRTRTVRVEYRLQRPGSSTSIAAVMQTRSRKVEMPSGLSLPLAFGMNTRLIGSGR